MSQVGITLANGFEEIEALMVVDLLRRAKIDISMISMEKDKIVEGAHGIKVEADTFFQEAEFDSFDMIVLPGGMPGTVHLMENEDLGKILIKFHEEKKWIAAICAAPTVLSKYEILNYKKATCYPSHIPNLTGANYVEEPVVVDGNIITSRGLGTAVDFALEIIRFFCGNEKAAEIKKAIIYEN